MVVYRNVRADLKLCELCYKAELVDFHVSVFSKKPRSRMTKWDIALAISKEISRVLRGLIDYRSGNGYFFYNYKRSDYEKAPEHLQKIIFLLQDENEGWSIKW